MTLGNCLLAIVLITSVIGCNRNPLDVDASNTEVNIKFSNFDEIISNSDSVQLMKGHYSFKKEIKDLYDYQMGYCLRIGEVEDSSFYNSIMLYRSDTSIQQLEADLKSSFPNLKKKKKVITDGFRHLKFHFPENKQPKHVVFMNSLFRSGVFCTENEIGIGLEWFLGDSNRVVQQLDPQTFYTWMKKGMNQVYLERDVITGWVETHYVDPAEGSLAEHMIRWGKVLYITEAAYPKFESNIILRFSKEDYQWALDNEAPFWKYLVDEKLLFKVDERTTNNMVGEGPFTPGLPDQEGPDRLGQFLGWRMVRNYMNNNEMTLEDLIDVPYNDILQSYEID